MINELLPDDPATVGPYRVLKRLGAGGMGQVFLGQSPGGRLVAVKVIRPELAREPGFRRRFAREVAAARNVSGLFTALVADADPDADVPWLATAYVAGPSLAEAVDEHGPLPVASVVGLAAGLAEGLSAIHAAGVVHRDLKPSNVLLAHDGPRVIDFGISRAVEATVLTQSGMVIGSPGFLSPEQADGLEVGPPSDIFSLGAVLVFAATGAGPFGAGPTPALVYRVVNRQPDISGVPEELRPVIGRCLARDPAERPAAADLLAELGGRGLTPHWLPAPVAADLTRYHAPTQGVALAAGSTPTAAAFTATVAGGNGPGPVAPGSPAPTSLPAAPGRGSRRHWWLAAAAAVVLAAASTTIALSLTTGGHGDRATRNLSAQDPVASTAASRSPVARSGSPSATAATHTAASHPAGRKGATVASGASASAKHTSGSGAQPTTPVVAPPAPAPVTVITTVPAAPVTTHATHPTTGTVPSVLGDLLATAESTLEAAGFRNISDVYQCLRSSDLADVVTQSPAIGTVYTLTQPVHLYLQATNCSTIPDVLDFTEPNAVGTLEAQGFTNITWRYECLGSSRINEVYRQTPAIGTSYGKNQLVTLELQADNCT